MSGHDHGSSKAVQCSTLTLEMLLRNCQSKSVRCRAMSRTASRSTILPSSSENVKACWTSDTSYMTAGGQGRGRGGAGE